MIGWLIYDQQEAVRNQDYITRYLNSAQKRNINLLLIYTEKLTFGLQEGLPFFFYEGNTIPLPDFAIVRTIYSPLSFLLEQAGVATYNSAGVAELCNDKQKTHQFLAKHNIPMMDTVFATKTGIDYLKFPYPFVAKPARGRGGKQVSLITNQVELQRVKEEIVGDDLILQQVAHRPGLDLRVYVIGNKIVAAMLRRAKEGIRSNFTLGGEASLYTLSPKETKLVEKIIHLIQPGLVGIDFLFHQEGLVLNEIEDVVGARMLYTHTNIDIADEYLAWIIGNLS